MVKVHNALQSNNLRTRMILQVHDELVFDVPDDEVETVKQLVRENMEGAMKLPNNVPVMAEAGVGGNWLEAH